MSGDEGGTGLSISAVSVMLGVPIPTIRSWERRYGIPVPTRTGGQHRRYDLEAMSQLRELRDEIAAGRRAQEAAEVIRRRTRERGPGRDYVTSILEASLTFDTEAVRENLERAHADLGFESSIQTVVLPSLREIGSMWEAGRCDVANEHLASQEVRAWLSRFAYLDPSAALRPPLVLACGPKDQHGLGLEAFGVLLARRGLRCRVLGALTPTPSLLKVIASTKSTGAVIVSHMNTNRRAAVESITAAADHGARVFYAGNAFVTRRSRAGLPGIYLGDDLPLAAETLEEALAS